MFSNNTSNEDIRQSIQTELASKTGLNNTSKSSLANQIVDSVSGALSHGIALTNSTFNSVYTALASEEMLTANAREFGVIRNVYSNVYLNSDSEIVELSMTDGSVFPEYFRDIIVIPKGREVKVGSDTIIQFVEDVYLNPGSSYANVSVRVSTTNGSDIPVNSRIKISDNTPVTNGLSLLFKENVNFRLVQEDDEQLRSRTQLAKIRTHGSSEYAITGWIQSTPTVVDYKMRYNDASNTYSIAVLTKNYIRNFEDGNSHSVLSSIRNKLDEYIGAESKFKVFYPDIYYVSFTYRYSNATEDICNAIISKAFENSYKYGSTEYLSIDDIRDKIKELSSNIDLENILIYHKKYGLVNSIDSGTTEIEDMGVALVDHSRTFAIEE